MMSLQSIQCRALGAPSRQRAAAASRRQLRLCVTNGLQLRFTGSGDTEHIGGEAFSTPGPFALKQGKLEVGRAPTCDILIPISTVSGRHALLEIENDQLTLTDFRSTNGTMINGAEIETLEPVKVPLGATIVFGDEKLAQFVLEMEPAAPAGDASAAPAAAASS
uniref:FHA domain-containing protein n=1 Tax=Chlamydomonas leiostraca TaxID=1034604 RepID=A0A7S0R2V2_9CHLO|mmetsp:Transcript_12354/g.30287  ORF Transcript_12354/g.30287 Transcript_12354/m.30287 type:complete len:164 (+) Transcript_12354:71-562(+)